MRTYRNREEAREICRPFLGGVDNNLLDLILEVSIQIVLSVDTIALWNSSKIFETQKPIILRAFTVDLFFIHHFQVSLLISE